MKRFLKATAQLTALFSIFVAVTGCGGDSNDSGGMYAGGIGAGSVGAMMTTNGYLNNMGYIKAGSIQGGNTSSFNTRIPINMTFPGTTGTPTLYPNSGCYYSGCVISNGYTWTTFYTSMHSTSYSASLVPGYAPMAGAQPIFTVTGTAPLIRSPSGVTQISLTIAPLTTSAAGPAAINMSLWLPPEFIMDKGIGVGVRSADLDIVYTPNTNLVKGGDLILNLNDGAMVQVNFEPNFMF